jgi:hypothetical protein
MLGHPKRISVSLGSGPWLAFGWLFKEVVRGAGLLSPLMEEFGGFRRRVNKDILDKPIARLYSRASHSFGG